MIYGHIKHSDTYRNLLSHPVWREAFQWIEQLPANIEPAIYQLRGDSMFVNVHGYETLDRAQCRFESHRRYLDLQYCIRGGELIDWELQPLLKPDGDYEEANDFQFYHPVPQKTTLQMLPGNFAIFHPSDGHRPKCADGVNPEVFKLVVKIEIALLA